MSVPVADLLFDHSIECTNPGTVDEVTTETLAAWTPQAHVELQRAWVQGENAPRFCLGISLTDSEGHAGGVGVELDLAAPVSIDLQLGHVGVCIMALREEAARRDMYNASRYTLTK